VRRRLVRGHQPAYRPLRYLPGQLCRTRLMRVFKPVAWHNWMNRCVERQTNKTHTPPICNTFRFSKYCYGYYYCSVHHLYISYSLIYHLIQQQRQRVSHLNQNVNRII
jgi:hypothetical protein